jgi:hypothetical protein
MTLDHPLHPLPNPLPHPLPALRAAWFARWPDALALWSRFTRLSEPRWCFSAAEAEAEGLSGSFAMIRLTDQAVVVNLADIAARGLDHFALEILAHEIGHHVYTPADLDDHARMITRARWGLPTRERHANFICNLYADLLINDRLQRSHDLSMAAVYQALDNTSTDPLWTFYMRTYEILWRIQKGTLAKGEINDRLEGDAHLGARLIRSYARDWLDGAGKYAALCLPYLLADEGQTAQQILRGWRDMENASAGGMPHGLTEMDPGEREGAIHPALDPELSGLDQRPGDDQPPGEGRGPGGVPGQHREPFQYGEILKALGVDLSPHEAAIRYYRERAAPHLVPFPVQERPESTEPLPEGLEPWDIGSPLEDADWLESVMLSPAILPGLTTVQRVWGTTEGSLPQHEPLDLDLYIDSSGSMPNPQVNLSYLALAGAIITLSALRAGGRVQATLWSGTRQFLTTGGFITDAHRLLEIITGHFGGATAFPIHLLRDTYAQRAPSSRPVHILHISDDGITTMFNQDERQHSGWDIARDALAKARGGGTMVLNLFRDWQHDAALQRAHAEQGWQIHVVRSWEDLVQFARWFSRLRYGDPNPR